MAISAEERRARNREHSKKYRAANRERINAYRAEYYQQHLEYERERVAAWKRANPERTQHAIGRRRSRKAGAAGATTLDEWVELLEEFDHACAYCHARGVPLTEDHLTPLSRGGSDRKDNIVPACRSCNSRKSTKTLLEFASRR